ncbi:MAG: hypothetical protein ACQCN6_08850 [Candidatus Bathyarchaeia archaeon]
MKRRLFLKELKQYLATPQIEKQGFSSHFEHDITAFPSKKEKFRRTPVSEKISAGDSLLLLPTYSFNSPAEFGNTQSAIYLTSEAQDADFTSFKEFLREIERLWTTNEPDGFAPASKMIPWSITVKGEIAYGSGSENLITALEMSYIKRRAAISIILQGIYGNDNGHTFFIVIGSDLRGERFTYNFLDFYLSCIPIEQDWINAFNKALDKLSPYNVKANNFDLRKYVFQKWESEEEINLKNGVVGGIGRSGYENKEWDNFEGLILKQEDLKINFSLGDDSWKLLYDRLECPNRYAGEYTVSIPRISYEEIRDGNLIGIRAPTIFLFGFGGKGWSIYAINIDAWPKEKEDSVDV